MKKFVLFSVLLLFLPILCKNEFYKTLGVDKKANDREIKKAYRNLAKKWHPDRYRDEKEKKKAEAKFMKISEAYETLSDNEKRQIYDEEQMYPQNSRNGMPRQQNGNRNRYSFKSNGARGFETFSNFNSGSNGNPFGSFADIFSAFGQGQPQGQGRPRTSPFNRQQQRARPSVSESFTKYFISSSVVVLNGNEIIETLGNSYRGNNIWFALLTTSSTSVELTSEKLNYFSEKYQDLFHFAAIDCSTKENNAFCRKQGVVDTTLRAYHPYQQKVATNVKKVNDVQKTISAMLDLLPSPLFIKSSSVEKELVKRIKSCLKSKQASLGCVFVFSEKVKESKISWKLKGIAHKLKDRAVLHIVNLKNDRNWEWLQNAKLPFVAVYRNNPSNKIDIRLEHLETTHLHGSSYTYLKEKLTNEVWQHNN